MERAAIRRKLYCAIDSIVNLSVVTRELSDIRLYAYSDSVRYRVLQ